MQDNRKAARRIATPPCVRIVARRSPVLSPALRTAAEALAEGIRAAEPAIDRIEPFGPDVRKGCGAGPKLLFGDSSEIPLMGEVRYNRLDYRIGFLADEGDLVVVGDARNIVFERYQRQVLGIERLEYQGVETEHQGRLRATPVSCLRDDAAFVRLLRFAKENGGATLFAYMTTGTIWVLAARLAAGSGFTIDVAGPPPLLSRRANDKLWFAEVASRLFGTEAVPAKRAAHGWSALVRHVGELARTWDRLVVKVPDSAGSAGNLVVDGAFVRNMTVTALHRHLREIVPPRMRGAPFPVAVEVWDVNVLTSPSVQVWIPDSGDGDPLIEGVFEQALIGEEGEFAGAKTAELPEDLDAMLVEQAFALSLLFQKLGYFGRCSFDAVIYETDDKEARLHWIECNARWGGVSIPMSLANRIDPSAAFAVVQCGQMPTPPRPFEEALDAAGVMPATKGAAPEVVLLSPNVVESGTGCHFMALGKTPQEALKRARRTLRRLRPESQVGAVSFDLRQ